MRGRCLPRITRDSDTAMGPRIPGIHHVTAIAGAAQSNVDFYTGFLGLRLVKRTVNFDDPETYHLYYGDELGRPGSILTFFPWPDAFQGKSGMGMASSVTFAIPPGAIDYWMGRFADEGRPFDAPVIRFGRPVIVFEDPDGLQIELTEEPEIPSEIESLSGWTSPVPEEAAIRHFHSVTLGIANPELTIRLLEDTFGYRMVAEEGGRLRFSSAPGQPGHLIDLVRPDPLMYGRMGKGVIHHIAFRAKDDEEQAYWQEQLRSRGFSVTPVRDRQYFRSIYFREPGGVLFEIATDVPGFTRDEAPDKLGSSLKLPEWLEPRRESLQKRLPELNVPNVSISVGRP